MIQSNAFESNASANANADESNANASANASAAKESSASANAAFALAFANASAFEHKPGGYTQRDHVRNDDHGLRLKVESITEKCWKARLR